LLILSILGVKGRHATPIVDHIFDELDTLVVASRSNARQASPENHHPLVPKCLGIKDDSVANEASSIEAARQVEEHPNLDDAPRTSSAAPLATCAVETQEDARPKGSVMVQIAWCVLDFRKAGGHLWHQLNDAQ
jgi:hypothetical protein